ncbi:MAG: hypothetical protein B7Z10_03360 [Rhodobacterales bacterium 32-66-7]|nr:MAG: hypothetical protein B7Z10_03360 [Rhodobacterales bacterium 32-66-7]
MSHSRLLSGSGSLVRAVFLTAALGLAAPVLAQDTAVVAERQAILTQMLAAPTDRELMRRYAALSVQLRDFEAAAATLERLVALEPGNSSARLELAVAYFALGNYDLAEYHLQAAQASGALTEAELADVVRYRNEAAALDQPSRFSGRLALGQAFTRNVDEQGPLASGALEWRLDMGGANADDFLVELAFSSFEPGNDSVNSRLSGRLRAGPEFRLTGDAYGLRLQPYVEVRAIRYDDDVFGDYNSWEVGLALQNPISASLTVYADLSSGQATEVEDFGQKIDFSEAEIGATWRPSRDTRFRATYALTRQEGENGTVQDVKTVRLSAQQAFDPGIKALPRRWVVGGFGQIESSMIDYGGFFDEDLTDRALGLWLTAFVTDEIFIETRATRISSTSEVFFGTFKEEETIMSIQLGWEF